MYPMTMKTTFDLPEALVSDVKRIAKARGTTARDLVQQALTRVVAEDATATPFTLRDMSVSGAGMTPEFANAKWSDILDESYSYRGLE